MEQIDYEALRQEIRETVFSSEVKADFYHALIEVLTPQIGKRPTKRIADQTKAILQASPDWPSHQFSTWAVIHCSRSRHVSLRCYRGHDKKDITGCFDFPPRGEELTEKHIDKIKMWEASLNQGAEKARAVLPQLREIVDGLDFHIGELVWNPHLFYQIRPRLFYQYGRIRKF